MLSYQRVKIAFEAGGTPREPAFPTTGLAQKVGSTIFQQLDLNSGTRSSNISSASKYQNAGTITYAQEIHIVAGITPCSRRHEGIIVE